MAIYPSTKVTKSGQGGISITRTEQNEAGVEFIQSQHYMNREEVSRMVLEEIPLGGVFLHLIRDREILATFFMDKDGRPAPVDGNGETIYNDSDFNPYLVREELKNWLDTF